MTRPKTKILVDGGDPHETQMVKELIGFVDGQTTNPSLIAKNPDIIRLVEAGHRLTEEQEADEYRALDLEQPWGAFHLDHELTTKGIEKFVADYRATLYSHAPLDDFRNRTPETAR